jgi:hypothetical protein
MTKVFRKAVVDETAEFIAAKLRVALNRHDLDSPLEQWLGEAPTYSTLNLGEGAMATLKALNLAALYVIADMPSNSDDTGDQRDEEERDVA